MDDSDQDFSFLCSRLLKRVRRKGGDSGDEKKITKDEGEDSGARVQSRSKAPCKRKREKKGGVQGKLHTASIEMDVQKRYSGEEESKRFGSKVEQKVSVKEKVLSRMQRFKRATPPRLVHTEEEATAESAAARPDEIRSPPTRDVLGPDEQQGNDQVMAERLQQELNRETESPAVVDVEDGGLFFCQLCYKDLSAMSHQLRTQHINRCLDERESSTSRIPAPPPRAASRPRVPECPICGRGFKSEKTRSTHLKRCSASMGVSPAQLLQALHKQAAELENGQRAGGSSDTSDSSMPARKKPRKKTPRMDEDTMVALALSRSLLEQEKERERDREDERLLQARLSSVTSVPPPVVQLGAGAGRTRGKRRKGAPPPLLLVQDPQAAQTRIQERVSSLLLVPRPPTPPTPTLMPSALSTHTLLWLKSALSGGGPASLCEFYTAELGAFVQPWIGAEKEKSPSPPVNWESAAASEERSLAEPGPCCRSNSSLGMPGTQALTDLVDLAEEGMTLTQDTYPDIAPAAVEPPLSGFVPEPTEIPRAPKNPTNVSRLCSDLGSMVNNPQLSDVQMQVDNGDVYCAHSFMLYTRCPLLANMVHDAGFGVQEEGFPRAQRVLLNDVSGEAVYALLQYLYTAVCTLTHTLIPDLLQLASRFGLSELQHMCEQYAANPTEDHREQQSEASPGPEPVAEPPADIEFLELLRSMWEDDGERGEAESGTEGEDKERSRDSEIKEDVVNEDELNEIYEFAATQRKMAGEAEASTESGEEEEEQGANNYSDAGKKDDGKQGVQMDEATDMQQSVDVDLSSGSNKTVRQSRGPDATLDRSYNRLFSESWGEYMEPHTQRLDRKKTPTSQRISSVSEVIDLSVSPPVESEEPARSLFPVTGVSPGETPYQSETVQPAVPRESLNAGGVPQITSDRSNLCSKHPTTSAKLSPPTSQPELIVLSDSSDDLDHDFPDEVPSPEHSPRLSAPLSRLHDSRYTHIKAKETTQVGLSPKKCNVSPDFVLSEPSRSDQPGSENMLDGSAEVSWLIPATPEPSTRNSSTQTSSGMRRIELFPRSHSSSSSANPKTASCSNPLKLPHIEQPSPAFQSLISYTRLSSHGDYVNPLHNSASKPCSSTPLHSDPRLQHLDSLGSPLLRESGVRNKREAEGRLGSLHLSPSENSPSPRLSSLSDKESSKSLHPGDPGDLEVRSEENVAVETSANGDDVREKVSRLSSTNRPFRSMTLGVWGERLLSRGRASARLESSEDQTSPPEQSSEHTFSPPGHGARQNHGDHEAPHDPNLPDAAMWDSWSEANDDGSQRLGAVALAKRVSQLRTPVVCKKKKNQAPLVPITPMPSFSDMNTPELKNRLNSYGVRPLPKKQMVLKLKEIHQYTHQLMSSGSEEETSPRNRPKAAPANFKHPTAPPLVSPKKLQFGEGEEEQDDLPASQDSSTSSTAESERSNPELCDSDDDGSDSEGVTASQAAVREKDNLQAVRSYILSDPSLYGRVLQYQPLSLSELKAGLRSAGIRLGTAKLLDFLDSQCITFTTAKQGHRVPSRRRGAGRGRKRLAKAV
ncbi:LOW QUALITY PROTEIN: structure-specific endonuclease subunit SLX4 [Silurus meridionalis]|uniref:LOW QUALITY PROTEIN: structure-specific endonuclease subunit SLX4 n=1 Tax=Silurus meridionalis TaxID=175797 RepID=UPI001EEB45E2|nr:LOW QUALITY PROTEIN: structure-specific endonuclease subunit SLX4 [Silurus meridionalis]